MSRTTEKKASAGGFLAILILGTIGVGFIYGTVKRFAPGADAGRDAAQLWSEYTQVSAAGGDMPGSGRIGQMRDACLSGLPGTGALGDENPGYGSTDALGRATVAWACIGSPLAVAKRTCDYPTGTTRATYTGWVQGHLVSFRFGGDGTRRDSGGCVNIVPQTGSVNKKISDGPENYAKAHPNIFYIAVPHYRADDSLAPVDAAKPDTLYYFAFAETGATPIAAWAFPNV